MSERVYVHVDCDCFYAQCEELRDDNLTRVPLGITQKYLIVTCNYKARARGVTKLMSISDAVQKCPELVLVDGSDLTPYKAVSDRIMDLLHVYGNVKRLGCDEMFVDVTDEVKRRLGNATPARVMSVVGHVWAPGKDSCVRQDSIHRVMDLRAMNNNKEEHRTSRHRPDISEELMEKATTQELFVGADVASDMRRVVMATTKIRMSAGIATSQIMAKLVSGLYKPNDQTILLPDFAKDFLASLNVRVIQGVGSVLSQKLAAYNIINVCDIWTWSREKLVDTFGEKQGTFLYLASQGRDPVDSLIVADSGEPKTISLEDSMRICSGFKEAKTLLDKLSPDLVYRIHAHYQKYGKLPATLTVTYRLKEAGLHERHACSTTMPKRLGAIEVSATALSVLETKLHEPFHLSLLNIAAKNFQHAPSHSIQLKTSHDGLIKSKRELRMARESHSRQDNEEDDTSFWRDLNDVDTSLARPLGLTTTKSNKRLATAQRKKITSFFKKKE